MSNSNHRIRCRVGREMLLGLLSLLIAGCGINKPFPEKGLYTIDAGQPEHPATQPAASSGPSGGAGSAGQAILQVPQLRIATPYDGNSFIYRVGPAKLTSDYYNGFITSPASLLTGQLISYLGQSGLYSYVVDGSSSVDYNLVLEGNVTELYGDYSRGKFPQAVIAIRFFLLRQSGEGVLVMHDKVYRATQPAKDDTPESLVQAWGGAYRQIMESLISDLRAVGGSLPAQATAR